MPTNKLVWCLRGLGSVLVLGGLGHTFGVARLYLTAGVPEANRVLLDVWVAEAQLAAGVFYMASGRALNRGQDWRPWAVAGAVTLLTYAVPFIPVLLTRGSPFLRVMPFVYLAASLAVLAAVFRRAAATASTP